MTCSLTIVRHGNTFAPGEPPRRIGARTDLPLDPSGEAQARALGRFFAREGPPFNRVLVSPLRRARRTAELILEELGTPIPIRHRAWLAEIDHGPDEDQPEDRVLARIGATALARWNEAMIAPCGWTVDAPARLAAWRTLLATATGHVLLVTSSGAARFAIHADPSLVEQAASLASPKLRTGAWGRIAVADGRARIEGWDRRPPSDALTDVG